MCHTQVKVSEEERSRIWEDLSTCRKSLVEHGILRRPAEQSSGFLTTTLRRYVNKQRMEQLARAGTEKDYEKVSKQWPFYYSFSLSLFLKS